MRLLRHAMASRSNPMVNSTSHAPPTLIRFTMLNPPQTPPFQRGGYALHNGLVPLHEEFFDIFRLLGICEPLF